MARTAEATDHIFRENEKEEVDPELLELPDPPRGERRSTLILMAVAAIASSAMAFSLTRDAAYAFGSASATDLGDITAAPTTAFVSNQLAQGRGRLAGAGALRYERPFESDSYRIAPMAGRPDVWVELRVPSGAESNRFVPKGEFSGRMIRFRDAGLRHRGLRSAIESNTGQKVGDDAWLIVDGQSPQGARAFAFLWAMFVAFAMWNIVSIVRLVRPVK